MKQLTLSILLMLLPLMASADAVEIDGLYYNLFPKAKQAEVTSNPSLYKGSIEIPSSVTYGGTTYNVTSIGNRAFYLCSKLTSITISFGITSIGEYAFSNCSGLTSATIPNSVTTLKTGAFIYCHSLTFVDIPNSVTSFGFYVFEGCTSLSSVTIPSNLTTIGTRAFCGCTSLVSLSLSNGIEKIETAAFKECTSLTTITIPNSVNTIGYAAFEGCSNLTELNIGSGVKTIEENAFANCSELTDVYSMVGELSSARYVGNGLYTYASAFENSFTEYATLHVPTSAINAYKTTEPWSGFKEFVVISGDGMSKCATPTINFENGKLLFNCKTEGVEYVSEITTTDTKKYYDSELTPSFKYKVSVYATKNGYENSDTAILEITASGKFGDLDGNGKVDVADHVKLTEIIMNQ